MVLPEGKITAESIEEVTLMISCEEQKLLSLMHRDTECMADFIDEFDNLWDIEIPISKNEEGLQVFYTQKMLNFLHEKSKLGYNSIIDITNLEENDANDFVQKLEETFNRKQFNIVIVADRENISKSKRFE